MMQKRSAVDEMNHRYHELHDFVCAIGTMESASERVAEEIDNAVCLRDLADTLQRVREHYWPLFIQAEKEMGR